MVPPWAAQNVSFRKALSGVASTARGSTRHIAPAVADRSSLWCHVAVRLPAILDRHRHWRARIVNVLLRYLGSMRLSRPACSLGLRSLTRVPMGQGVENMSYCEGCGHELDNDAIFCGECGSKRRAVPICTTCGLSLTSDAHFCPGCGRKVEQDEQAFEVRLKESGSKPDFSTRSANQSPAAPQMREGRRRRVAPIVIGLVLSSLLIITLAAWLLISQAKSAQDNAITEQAIGTWHCVEDGSDSGGPAYTYTVGDGEFRVVDDQSEVDGRSEPFEGSWEITNGKLEITGEADTESIALRFLIDADLLSEDTDQIEMDRQLLEDGGSTDDFSIRASVDVISHNEVRFSDAQYRHPGEADWDAEDEGHSWTCTRQ